MNRLLTPVWMLDLRVCISAVPAPFAPAVSAAINHRQPPRLLRLRGVAVSRTTADG